MGKTKQQDNPFIEPSQQHAMVDMRGKIAYQSLRREPIAQSMAEGSRCFYLDELPNVSGIREKKFIFWE